ncbi:MAG: hypothetical protein MJ208_01240 [Bacilli bacterium]|nr:hypothetical protein [Bacilli bacterium]
MKAKFKTFLKKRMVSLKRNFYTLPFVLSCLCCFFFLSTLFILIKSVGRIEYKPTSIFLFIAVLTSILSIVALVNYTKKVYGQERPLKMLIIYYAIIAVCLIFTIAVFVFNEKQIAAEIVARDSYINPETGDKRAEWYICQTFINYGVCSRVLMIIFFIFESITNGLLIASPFIEKKLSTINFDKLAANEQKSKR